MTKQKLVGVVVVGADGGGGISQNTKTMATREKKNPE